MVLIRLPIAYLHLEFLIFTVYVLSVNELHNIGTLRKLKYFIFPTQDHFCTPVSQTVRVFLSDRSQDCTIYSCIMYLIIERVNSLNLAYVQLSQKFRSEHM